MSQVYSPLSLKIFYRIWSVFGMQKGRSSYNKSMPVSAFRKRLMCNYSAPHLLLCLPPSPRLYRLRQMAANDLSTDVALPSVSAYILPNIARAMENIKIFILDVIFQGRNVPPAWVGVKNHPLASVFGTIKKEKRKIKETRQKKRTKRKN